MLPFVCERVNSSDEEEQQQHTKKKHEKESQWLDSCTALFLVTCQFVALM